MKKRLLLPMIVVTGVSAGFLSGCYTQLAVYDEEPVVYHDDAYEADDVEDYEHHVFVPRSRFWLSYSFGYPSWYYSYYPSFGYSPYYWDQWSYWNHTIIYPYPYWWDYPHSGYAYSGWYWNRPLHYVYNDPYYTYRSGLASTTRNSGVRRSGTARRRDYDGSRTSGTGRTSVAATSVGGRPSTGRNATNGRTPSIEFTRPRTNGSGGRAVSSDRRSSNTRSMNIWDIIGRATSRSSRSSVGTSRSDDRKVSTPRSSTTRSQPAARSSRSSSSRPSYSRPSSSSRSSSSGRSSGSRSSGSSRSRSSGRNR